MTTRDWKKPTSTQDFIKSEWNMTQLDFWRFHALFDNADELGYYAYDFINNNEGVKGVLNNFDNYLAVLRMIYINLCFYINKKYQEETEKVIDNIEVNLINVSQASTYNIKSILMVYKQLTLLHKKLIAMKILLNLGFKTVTQVSEAEILKQLETVMTQ